MVPHIQRLSSSVKSKLRSGVNISSVSQCVEELVLNAVDSGATNIAVRVDLSIFRIQVVDNGFGIPEQDMKLIGTRYATSKCHSLEDLKCNLGNYGFRGEALASIVELSGIVDISSRYKTSSKTFEKLFTYGKAKPPTLCKYNKPSCGTTITIQDFMYNMPVRRKSIKESIDFELMKSNIERVMLISPHIAITLKNERIGCNILEIRKSKSLLEAFLQLHGNEHESNMAEVCHSLGQFNITGYISTQPHQTKKLQFVYINKRSVLQTKIHALLNDLLSRSSIIRSKTLPNSNFSGPGKVPSSPPKGLKFYGVFILNIVCPRTEYDVCLDPKKTLVEFRDWEKLLVCVEELVLKFIKEENLIISLDDRFRKSEKEDSISDFETPIPHSSQTILQAFSNTKQRGDKEEFSKLPLKRIGLSDGIPALYSLPARRNTNVNIINSNYDHLKEKPVENCNTEVIETNKNCSESKTSKALNNCPKYQLNCERNSPTKSLSSLQVLKHVDKIIDLHNNNKPTNGTRKDSVVASKKLCNSSPIEQNNKPIHRTRADPDCADKKKLCYSSLQQLKFANCKDPKDSYVTPTNKIVPSVYPTIVNRSVDETLDIYNDKQSSCVQKPQTETVKESKHHACNTVSHTLGKQYKEVIKKKNILNSLQNFHFNKVDRPQKNMSEEKTVKLQNGAEIHNASNNNNFSIYNPKPKQGRNDKFFIFDTTEDTSLDDINIEDLLNDKSSFNFEGDVKKSHVTIAQNSHQNMHSFIGKTKQFHIHCDSKLVSGEKSCNEMNNLLNNFKEPEKLLVINNNTVSATKMSHDLENSKIFKISDTLDILRKPSNQCNGISNNHESQSGCGIISTQAFVVTNLETKSSDIKNPSETNSTNITNTITQTIDGQMMIQESSIVDIGKTLCAKENSLVDKNNLNSNSSICIQENIDVSKPFDSREYTEDFYTIINNIDSNSNKDVPYTNIIDSNSNESVPTTNSIPVLEEPKLNNKETTEDSSTSNNNIDSNSKVNVSTNNFNINSKDSSTSNNNIDSNSKVNVSTNNSITLIEEPKDFSLRLDNLLNNDIDRKDEEISDNSLSSGLKNDLLNFINSDKTSSQERRDSINERIKKYSESSQVHFEGKILQIRGKKKDDCNASTTNDMDLISHDDNDKFSSSCSEKFVNNNNNNTTTTNNNNNINNNNNNNTVTQDEVIPSSWKRVCNEGKSFYVNIRTGNSSYDAPRPPDPVLQWDSDKKMGSNVLKIPITDEYDPLGLDKRNTLDSCFSLSHGFDAFMPTKRKQLSEVSNSRVKRISLPKTTSELKADYSSHTNSKNVEENNDRKNGGNNQLCLSSKMEEALNEFLIENMLVEEPSKWGNTKETITSPCEENSDETQRNDFWENERNFPMDAEILASYAESNPGYHPSKVKCYSIIHPYKFTKEMLKSCKVFGQVDDKFIAIGMTTESSSLVHNLIVLVDQHAADERNQLEKVLFQSFEIKTLLNGIRRKVFKSERLNSPIEATFKEEQVRIMKNFRDSFFEIGLEFTLVNDIKVLFHCLPCCLVAKEPNDRTTRRCQTAAVIVHATVVEMCENICTLGGASNVDDVELARPLPRALSHVMNTIACKSAVKFGDKLSQTECEQLISSLIECRLPFQCAHGRPSLIPIVDLNYIKHKSKNMKPNLKKLRSLVSC